MYFLPSKNRDIYFANNKITAGEKMKTEGVGKKMKKKKGKGEEKA